VNGMLSKYKEEIGAILAKYPPDSKRSAVMPLLHLAQREQGYVSKQAMVDIGELLGISTTEVASVAGFYSLYYEEPQGRYHIQVCNDLPCTMRGADQFLAAVCEYLGVGVGETTPDGLFTVEAVKCLAACHRAPVFQVQGDGDITYHENQTLETVKSWIEEVRRKVKEDAQV